VKQASELLLATDPDREGESISCTSARSSNRRSGPPIVFHEITEEPSKNGSGRARPRREPLKAQESAASWIGSMATRCRRSCGRRWPPAERRPRAERRGAAARRARRSAAGLRSSRYWTSSPAVGEGGNHGHAVRVGDERLATGKTSTRARAPSRTPASVCWTRRRPATGRRTASPPAWDVTSVEARPGSERPAPRSPRRRFRRKRAASSLLDRTDRKPSSLQYCTCRSSQNMVPTMIHRAVVYKVEGCGIGVAFLSSTSNTTPSSDPVEHLPKTPRLNY